MTNENNTLAPVLYLPHGGGPLPLLGDPGHTSLVAFLQKIVFKLGQPDAILVISAHWEETQATITAGATPELIYDYYGFPEESYDIQYPAPGYPALAARIYEQLQYHGVEADLDEKRGFDHGVFVPLKLMYPDAGIPCVQLSLLNHLNPEKHIELGKALAALRQENILIIGSGLSFHNLGAFFTHQNGFDEAAETFHSWLVETCCGKQLGADERKQRLIEWERQPTARFCHPREEHLLPLHVCYGMASEQTPMAELVFDDAVMGRRVAGFLW